MFRNYFYLNRAVIELGNSISNSTIVDVYSQEKDRLYFHIPTEEYPNQHLIISTDQNMPFLQLRKAHHKAKKNRINFYNNYFPAIIEKIEMAIAERVIKITFTSGDLYFMLRGSNSNIYFISDDNQVENFKKQKISSKSIIEEFERLQFTESKFIPDLSFTDNQELSFDILKTDFPFVIKEIINEVNLRNVQSDSSKNSDFLYKVLNEIFDNDISIFYSDEQSKLRFCSETFISLGQNVDKSNTFTNYNDAISFFISNKYKSEKETGIKKIIEKHLEKELTFVANKLNKLKPRLEKGNREDEYRQLANLLLMNKHQLQKGFSEISLTDYESGKDVKISLNKKKSGQENIDSYFEKARDERINFEKSEELFYSNESIYNNLLAIKAEFENAVSLDDFEKIKSKLKIKDKGVKKTKMELDIKLRHFVLDGTYHVFVGRDSKSNDLLSTRFAKQNDYWFHARGLPGSHTTLRVDNPKEGVPKNIIKNAASIAAYYSKAKTAKMAPVSYTLRKFVHKKKGMAPGKVLLSKENVLLVTPEIPKNAEQIED